MLESDPERQQSHSEDTNRVCLEDATGKGKRLLIKEEVLLHQEGTSDL